MLSIYIIFVSYLHGIDAITIPILHMRKLKGKCSVQDLQLEGQN